VLPLERLHLYENTEQRSFSFSILLRRGFVVPFLFFLFFKIFHSDSFLSSYLRIKEGNPFLFFVSRRSLWRISFFRILWTFELQRDLSLEEDLWYMTENRNGPKTSAVIYRELTPRRVRTRRYMSRRFLPLLRKIGGSLKKLILLFFVRYVAGRVSRMIFGRRLELFQFPFSKSSVKVKNLRRKLLLQRVPPLFLF